ncbi:hypothetical protein C725_2674 [Pacificimonas flava]|uniref:Uncharacterized protein n=1 Tax=Pacificimonas flava TaxID=1234595 RepID=M2U2G9_9SPHN|nr:hypothetical protein C725_2674 [Pacificimonas flava]
MAAVERIFMAELLARRFVHGKIVGANFRRSPTSVVDTAAPAFRS